MEPKRGMSAAEAAEFIASNDLSHSAVEPVRGMGRRGRGGHLRSIIAAAVVAAVGLVGYSAAGLAANATSVHTDDAPSVTEQSHLAIPQDSQAPADAAFSGRGSSSSRDAVRESLNTAVAGEAAKERSAGLAETSVKVDKAAATGAASSRLRTLEEDLALVKQEAARVVTEKKAAESELKSLVKINGGKLNVSGDQAQALAKALANNTGVDPMKPGTYRTTATFGQTGLWARYHTGYDFAAPTGVPIYAPAAGVVGSSTGSWWAGNNVIIHHKDGDSTLYAHMSRKVAEPGQVVLPGDLIGYVGGTGNVTGPHLHFEFYPAGATPGDIYSAKNPLLFFKKYGINP